MEKSHKRGIGKYDQIKALAAVKPAKKIPLGLHLHVLLQAMPFSALFANAQQLSPYFKLNGSSCFYLCPCTGCVFLRP